MRLDDYRDSGHIESQRGMGGGGGGMGGLGGPILGLIASKFGIGGVIVAVLLMVAFSMFGGGGGGGSVVPAGQQAQGGAPAAATDATDRFVSRVLATTEDTWSRIFQQSGQDYPEPNLVLYSGYGQSGCGAAQSAVGPFYCPSDQKIYLDTSFFDELGRRFGAPGDFAAAYVIAHEVGHHVQTVTGVADRVRQGQSRASKAEANELQVRMELQADCYAGVWGRANQSLLEQGDLEEALTAASAIGDDTIQKQSGRAVVPDSFTHGSSAQRTKWFRTGYDSGDPAACDTFSARSL